MSKEDDEMKLPEGETCGTCYWSQKCLALGYTSSAENTRCDFHPIRFHKARIDVRELTGRK